MRPGARLPLLAAALCVAAFVTLLLGAYLLGPVERLDATALHGLGALRGSWADSVAHLLPHLADPLPLVVILAAICAAGWALGRRRQAIAAAALVAGANVVAQMLKVALAHPRVQAVGVEPLGPEAFPSGHATASMSVALAAVLVAPARWRATVASLAAAYVIGVCTSILVLGWHFPSDVIGGLLVASGVFFCVVAALVSLAATDGAAARERLRLAVSPRRDEAALIVLGGLAIVVLLRAPDLLAFARLHTVATATAIAVVAASAGLLATAALIADDRL
jgi:membrane-associated phospholipid phosphatase